MKRQGFWVAVAAIAAGLILPGVATAGLIPVRVSVTPDGGNYRYTYAVVLPTDSVLRPGDYFTIYDFDGFIPGSEMASGSLYSGFWSFAAPTVGPTPAGVLPSDDPAITNLTWTYHGPVIGIDSSVGLGNFWALSIYPDTKDSWFTASTGTTSGYVDNNITPTVVPVPRAPGTEDPPPAIPEPAAWVLVGIGLPLAPLLRRRPVL